VFLEYQMAGKVQLKPVDRDNWRAMARLSLRPEQEHFVSAPAWSLAGCYVRKYGDNYEYSPMVICDGDIIVGYVTLVCDPASSDDYWVDDIVIDAIYQGRGFGRAAMELVLAMIPQRYPQCRGIKLTCFRDNLSAAALYLSLGFKLNGEVDPMFKEPVYALTVKPPPTPARP
jgi:diamine N-acetyltransferase